MREVTVGVAPDMPGLGPWRYALDVADGWRGRLRAVIVNDSFTRGAPTFADGDLLEESTKRLRDVWETEADEIEGRIEGLARKRNVKLNVVRREGRVVDVLLDAAGDSELIVVGRGRGASKHPGSLGSRVEHLVRRCPLPLLMTPLEYRRPRRVVAAYGGKALGERVLDLGAELARALELELLVLTVGEDRGRIREVQGRASARLSERIDDVELVGVVGKPEETIPAKVGEEDVLVLGPHGRSPLYRMLLGRVTDRVIRAVRGPLALTARES